MEIVILGPGCSNCVKLENNVREASKLFGFEHSISKISDYSKINDFGVMQTPALVVNNEVVSKGKVLTTSEVLKIANNYVK